ncbi:MAG: YCF48-related protein [Melioribacteraceae bacterium]|nr:YCF48-related protein [Melioribacteraceae bacterium]
MKKVVFLILVIRLVTFAQFETNYSFNLNGSNSARTTATAFPAPNYITLTAWIYLNSTAEQTIVATNYNNSGTNSGQFEVFINSSGGLNFLTRVSGADIFSGSPGTLETGKWYFIVGKYDGTNAQSFINGILSSTSATASGVIDNSTPHPFSIGCQEDPSSNRRNYFNGLIENLAVWNTSLDINLIKDWMHKELTTSHPYYSNLMAFYKFNGANGNTYMWDATSNARHLLITGNKNCYSTDLPPMCYVWGKLKDSYSEVRGIWSANLSNSSSILTITSSSLSGTTNVLWGHNNKSIVWTYFDIPNTVLRRLDRIWYTEKEGSPTGNFVFSTSGLSFSDGNRLRMLVDQDGSFYNAQIVNGVYSSDNNTFTVSNVSIGNNYYYTLAELTEGGGNSGPPSEPPPWKWKSPKPQGNNLRAVTIVDNNKFYAVGYGGTIVYTENGGTTFSVTHYVNNFIKSLNDCGNFPGTNTHIAVGDDGGYFKSSDYGKTWMHLNDIGLPENFTIKTIHFIDENNAFIAGSEGRVYKTTNAGNNWSNLTTPLTGTISTINFYNSQIGWIFDEYLYATTTNGGSNWQWKFNLPAPVNSASLLNETDGLIATNDGKIYKTTNLGDNWNEVYSGSNSINKLKKQGGGNLILGVGDGGTIKKSTDNGSTWTSPTSPSLIDKLNDLYIKDNRIVIVGDKGITLKSTDGGDNFVVTDVNVLIPLYKGFIQSEGGWFIIADGKMFKSTNGGETWQVVLDQSKIKTGDWVNSNIGYASGSEGFLQKTTNSGNSWIDKSIGTNRNVSNIKYRNSGSLSKRFNLYKVQNGTEYLIILYIDNSSNQQVLAKSSDDGNSWTTIRTVSSSSNEITKDYTFGGNNLFVCTKDGKVLKSTNYGTNWTTTTFTYSTSFTGISLANANNGYVIGTKGIVYRTTDGGTTWVQRTNCSNDDLNCVAAISANQAIVSSTTGTIYETTDGGNTWKTSVTGLSSTINQLLSVPKTQLQKRTNTNSADFIYYAIGEGGMILENSDGGIGLFPIELMYFTANVINNSVKLIWQTATELNNYGFDIERASTSLSTQPTNWQNIGFVKGNGNSNSPKHYSFIDQNPIGGKLKYRLKQIDSDGSFSYSNEIEIYVNIPKVFALEQNYPNPFNPTTTISFTLQEDGLTTLKIYDLLGREVKTLVNEELKAGQIHRINFDGSGLASGVYFYKLESKSMSMIRKFVLMK